MGSRYVRVFQQFGYVGNFGNLWNRGYLHPFIAPNLSNCTMMQRNVIAIQIHNAHFQTSLIATQKLLRTKKLDENSCRDLSEKNKGDDNETVVKGKIEGSDIASTNSSPPRPPVSHQDCPFEPHPFPHVPKSEDVCTPGSDSSPTATPGSVSGIGTTGTVSAGSTTTTTPSSGFCAGVSPTPPKKESSSSGSGVGANIPDVKLPDRKQVEKTFFRILAYIYDFSALVINWIRKVVCRYIIMNPTIQQHWHNLRAKMEAAKKA